VSPYGDGSVVAHFVPDRLLAIKGHIAVHHPAKIRPHRLVYEFGAIRGVIFDEES
jgi:DNA phosphorothioation-dependent restriction protein DptG